MKGVRSAAQIVVPLFIVGAVCFFAMSRLKDQAQWIVKDTLTGLSYAGKSISSLSGTVNRLYLALNAPTPVERETFLHEVDEYNRAATQFATKYRLALYMDEDCRNFAVYVDLLSDYQKRLQEAVKLIKDDRRTEARKLLGSSVIPAFRQCMVQADKLLDYNVALGEQRGKEILQSCERTQLLFAGLGTVLFAMGFVLAVFRYVFYKMYEKT